MDPRQNLKTACDRIRGLYVPAAGDSHAECQLPGGDRILVGPSGFTTIGINGEGGVRVTVAGHLSHEISTSGDDVAMVHLDRSTTTMAETGDKLRGEMF